jgi:hypothetical protein
VATGLAEASTIAIKDRQRRSWARPDLVQTGTRIKSSSHSIRASELPIERSRNRVGHAETWLPDSTSTIATLQSLGFSFSVRKSPPIHSRAGMLASLTSRAIIEIVLISRGRMVELGK